MKNQYVGDVGDYGKYSLFRFLAENGIKIGINWYLTKNDETNDGKHITYLDKTATREYDPAVFDTMKKLVMSSNRNVDAVEKSGVIPQAVFYNEILSTTNHPWQERESIRKKWHKSALEQLSGASLVFADPDNGTIGAKNAASKNAEKFTLLIELADYYDRGQNIVYYCQKARRNEAQWAEKKKEMLQLTPDAKIYVLTFHRGTQRSYIFVIHPENFREYAGLLYRFLETTWGTKGNKPPFTYEA